MKKQLKFMPHLVRLVLSGKKTTTWRLWDNKGLQAGDVVDFLESGTNKLFATARLIKVYEKTLGALTEEDWAGHERFQSEQDMYEHYRRYYQREVEPGTLLKIISFELITN